MMDDTTQTLRVLGALAYGAMPMAQPVSIGGSQFHVAQQHQRYELAPVLPHALLRRVLCSIEELLSPRRDTRARARNYSQLLNRTLSALPSTPSPAEYIDWPRMPLQKLTRAQLETALAAGQKDFRNVWLQGQDLRQLNLQGVDLRDADLRYAKLAQADLRHADLRAASLSCAQLQGAQLAGANLCFTNLNGALLDGADLTGANFKHATLREASLHGVKVADANLENVQFSALQSELQSADFSGVRCLSPKLDYLNSADKRSQFLNHRQPGQQSLQRQIGAHPHPAVRLSLMRQLVEKMNAVAELGGDLASLHLAFLDVLLDPLYLNDRVIHQFSHRCMAGLIEQAAQQVLDVALDDALLLAMQMHLLAGLAHDPSYALQHSAAIMQTVFFSSERSRSENVRIMLPQLQTAYEINLPAGLRGQLLAWRENMVDDSFAVCARDGLQAIFISSDYFAHLLLGRPLTGAKTRMAWGEAVVLRRSTADGVFEQSVAINYPREEFRPFPWLLQAFLAGQGGRSLASLFDAMPWEEFRAPLLQALQQLHYTGPKLVDPDQQLRLECLLSNWASRDTLVLGELQLNLTLSCFPWQMAPDDQAYLLIALARLFAALASVHYLGTEWDSPRALRYLAVAMLAQAHQLSASILPPDLWQDWRHRLLGEHNAFTCASVVAGMMAAYLSTLPTTLVRSWIDQEACPQAWR